MLYLLLLSLATSPLVFAVADTPQFVLQPRDTSAISGETVTLYCSVSGQQGGQFVWVKDGNVITRGFSILVASDSHRFSIGMTGVGSYNLVISHTEAGDSGSYRCVVTTGGTGLISNTANLQIWSSPTVEYPTCTGAGSGEVAVGETLALACDVEGGNPKAQLFLNRGDVAVETRETATGIAYDWTVAETDESAEFICIGTQRFWAEPRTCRMGPFRLVRGPPAVSLVPAETTIQAGQSVSFLCNAESAPRAAYKWLVGGQEVDSEAGSTARMTVQTIGSSSVLLVNDAGNEVQSVQILCVVNAATGTMSARAVMHVEPVYTVVTGPPPTGEPSSAETDQDGQGAPNGGTPTEEDDEGPIIDEGPEDYQPSTLPMIVGGAVAGVAGLLILIVVIALVARRGRASSTNRSTEKLAEGAPEDNDVYFRSRFVGIARSWLFPVHQDTQKGMAASMASQPNQS
ncbi:kin of IRRE-like protein 2 [Patiria miniata]|uniref:Ig-like domain-containing protein n=1 Tax=Patiria miniata TaxID=46514 RepID=A0A913ZAT5_PATMI|nr:kin of IRRE-like protein 2 [Patiria miniata]